MKAAEALIARNANGEPNPNPRYAPPGSVGIGPMTVDIGQSPIIARAAHPCGLPAASCSDYRYGSRS